MRKMKHNFKNVQVKKENECGFIYLFFLANAVRYQLEIETAKRIVSFASTPSISHDTHSIVVIAIEREHHKNIICRISWRTNCEKKKYHEICTVTRNKTCSIILRIEFLEFIVHH